MTITAATFQTEFQEINNKFIPFVTEMKNSDAKYRLQRIRMKNLFKNAANWQKVPQRGGHMEFKNVITGITVCWQSHKGKNKGSELDPGQAVDIHDQVQKHINRMGNEIFQFSTGNWKIAPNFNQVMHNYGG